MKINSYETNKMTINPRKFGNKNILFNEKDGIVKSILKIKLMDENEKFSCNYKELNNYFPSANYKITDGNFNIESMISYSGYISQIFIKYAIEYNIPFLNEGVAILIDCSGYINKENKLLNMHLIYGLTGRLNSICIPYSVALISDDIFK